MSFTDYHQLNYLIMVPIAVIIFGFIFLNGINHKYEDKILSQNKNLEKAYGKIEQINNHITDSILYARHIQKAILPNNNLYNKYFAESFIYYKPCTS